MDLSFDGQSVGVEQVTGDTTMSKASILGLIMVGVVWVTIFAILVRLDAGCHGQCFQTNDQGCQQRCHYKGLCPMAGGVQ